MHIHKSRHEQVAVVRIAICVDLCIDMCADMCTEMRMDMCKDAHSLHTCTSIGVQKNMCILLSYNLRAIGTLQCPKWFRHVRWCCHSSGILLFRYTIRPDMAENYL